MTTLQTTSTTEFRKRVYFDESPTHGFNDKSLTPLMKACMFGRSEQIKLILEEKPQSVLERDSVFKTALHYCAENDDQDAECAKLLLEVDSSLVDIPDHDGHTALHLAVIAGNLPLVRFLLISSQADPNKRDVEGHSTVHWATVCADVEALELVLGHGGTTSSADVHGGYAIHYAAQMCGTGTCRSGEVRNVGVCVLQTLLAYGADVNVADKHRRQPILWAASAGSADAIITLVNGGANVESHDKDGLTALHCAASRGHVECVDALLTLCGSEVDAVDSNSCSALFYAVTLGHADATEILLEHGANPDRQDGKGRTPAHCGAFKGQLETVRLLSEHGANLWLRNLKGGYPLHDAMRSGRKELVVWLISMRPESVDYYDNDGKRPLHIAALNNNLEMSKIILDNGASINPVMKIKGERMTPLDVALRKNNGHLAKFLHLYGAKPANKLNKTSLKQQSTVRVKTKRSEPRRNSYSSDSISRKYRGDRKKQNVRRNGENLKTNKATKGRVVQVHIRADVLTKTIGKTRNDKKSCDNSTFPKSRRRKATTVNHKSKECLSENDLCNGDDYDCTYDYEYEDYDDDDDEDDDNVSEDRGQEQDDSGSIQEQTNSSTANHCNGKRHKNKRNSVTKMKVSQDGGTESIRESKKASSRLHETNHDKVTTNKQSKLAANDVGVDNTHLNSDIGVKQEITPDHVVLLSKTDGGGDDQQPNPKPANEVVQDKMPNTTAEVVSKNGDSSKCIEEKTDGDSKTLKKIVDAGNGQRSTSKLAGSAETTRDKIDVSGVSGVTTSQTKEEKSKTKDRGDTLPTTKKRNPPTTKCSTTKTDKMIAERLPIHEDGNPALGQSKNCNTRAIVEVLDRVDTPQLAPTSIKVVGDVGSSGEPTAFSVLPNEGQYEDKMLCECFECRKNSFRSSSKKMKSRIPRLNNYCSLAPNFDLNTMSVTRAVQLSNRKYHLERLIFYQLSELKRLQIRAGKSDERVLVKRLVEEYGNTGLFTGLKRYDGPFSFKRFEKYLYDQLLVLQKQTLPGSKTVIPRVKSIEEINKLTGALRRIDAGKTVLEQPNDFLSCVQTTNRCFHSTQAYTGVPCALYIPKSRVDHHRLPKSGANRRRFLPDIRQQDPPGSTKCLRNVDPSRPITLQLNNGSCTQAIDLPTDKLDKNKRYFVTFTIKGTSGDGQHEKNRPLAPLLRGDNRGHHDPDDCHPPLAHIHAKSF